MTQLLDTLGFAVCHQLPERSLSFGGALLSICARDTGIYLGLVAGFVYLTALNRRRQSGLPPWYVLAFGVLGLGLMAADGLSSYMGLRATTNGIRLATGLMAGGALPLVLVPIFNFQVWKETNGERVMRNIYHFLGYLVALVVVFLVVRTGWAPLFWPVSLTASFAVLFAFVYINLILVTLIPVWMQKAERLTELAVPLALAAVLAAAELFGSYQFHAYLLSRLT